MGTRTVTTQAELDAALAEHVDIITINSPRGVWLTISHECGGGLHLCLTPSKSRGYYSMATRYVECLIDVTEAVVVDRDKVKARSVRVIREVTIDGEPVTA